MRRVIDPKIKFHLLAYHAGAQWAPILFDNQTYAGAGITNTLFHHACIVGMPLMPRSGCKNGGHCALGSTLLTSRVLWMYFLAGWCF